MAKIAKDGWNKFPDCTPPDNYGMYKTDAGDLYWDNGVWLLPEEYNGWNPADTQPTLFYVVPDYKDEN